MGRKSSKALASEFQLGPSEVGLIYTPDGFAICLSSALLAFSLVAPFESGKLLLLLAAEATKCKLCQSNYYTTTGQTVVYVRLL